MTSAELSARLFAAAGCADAGDFLRRVWQREPTHLRQVTQDLSQLVSAEALQRLACQAHVESRLVIATGDGHWRAEHGPFSAGDFTRLPQQGWTLLVQDVDKHLAGAAEFLQAFDFVPRWRLDDLMVSYAAPGGSVGPHVDSYDVFLFQALGRRRWELSRGAVGGAACPDCEVKVLSSFEAEHSFELACGDCLYLPAEIAHYGVALEPCMTFSVGFRTLTAPELLGGALLSDLTTEWLARALEADAAESQADALAAPPQNPGEIGQHTLERYRRLARVALALDPERLDRLVDDAVIRCLTEPKESQLIEPPEAAPSLEELLAQLSQGGRLQQHPASRWLYFLGVEGAICLAVDGENSRLEPEDRRFAELLCDAREIAGAELMAQLELPRRAELVLGWLASGQLLLASAR